MSRDKAQRLDVVRPVCKWLLQPQKGAVTVELASGVGSLREQACLTFRGQVCLIRLTEGAGLL